MANPNPDQSGLKPFPPGQSGNPGGKKKGVKNFATLVKEVMGDDELLPKLIDILPPKKKPRWFFEIEDKRVAKAMITAMVLKAVGGDDKAFSALIKSGYGSKVDFTSDDKPIQPLQVLNMNPPTPAKPKPKKGKADGKSAKGSKSTSKRSVRNGSKPKSQEA